MRTPASILERLLPLSCVEGYDDVECFLRDRSTLFPERWSNFCTTVAEANRVWGTRLFAAESGGIKPAPGLRPFVAALKQLSPGSEIEQFRLNNSDQAAFFWFDKSSEKPVGFVLVNRSHQMLPQHTFD